MVVGVSVGGRPVARALLAVLALVAMFAVAVHSTAAHAIGPGGTTPLSSGNLAMVSTHADGTSGMPESVEGANEIAISDDGSIVAFVSDVPAQELVTDPIQLARGVTDNNTDVGTTYKGDDVFLYEKLPGGKNVISLASENLAGTGTGNAPAYNPVIAPHGLGVVFESGATDMVSGSVADSQVHLYAYVPGYGSLAGVSLIDTKYGSSDACNCSAEDPSISLFPTPTVVFLAKGSSGNELIGPGIQGLGVDQVYAHDIVTGTNTLVSVTDDNTVPNARSSTQPDVGNGSLGEVTEAMIASDAPIVVFTAIGDDLIDGFDSSNGDNIWERNLLTNTTTLVSVSAGGNPNGTSGNHNPVISSLGTTVAWQSNDPDVSSTPFQHPGQSFDHVFAKVIVPATPTIMVDTNTLGVGCDDASHHPGISGNGLFVVFDSDCDDLTTTDTNGDADVFERLVAPVPGPVELLSHNDAGTDTGNGDSTLCEPNDGNFNFPCDNLADPSGSVDFDGTVVTYYTAASDIAEPAQGTPPFNGGSVIASYPLFLGGAKNVLVTNRPDGAYSNGMSGDAVVSKDGSSVAFVSSSYDLVPGDTNGYFDAFEADLHNQFFFQPIDPVDEGAGSVTIDVIRKGNNGTADSVEVKTGDGFDTSIAPNPFPDATQATAPADYTAVDQTLHFPPGVAVESFQVPIVDDNLVEGPEVFHVSLSASGAGGAGLPGPASDAYVEILDNDAPPQDWQAAVSTEPAASAPVGSTVTIKTTISVDAGTSDLTVNSLGSGPATSGLDDVAYSDTTFPFTVTAGTTHDVTATARVTAAPGTSTAKLETSIDGTLGANESTKTADSDTISSTEAVTTALTGGPASANLGDPITYALTLSNASDTPVQVTVPDAGFAAPTGTTEQSRTAGSATIDPHSQTTYTLAVSVDAADADGATLTEAPTGVTYAMSDVALPDRAVSVTPQVTTVDAPVLAVGPHTITDHDGGTLLAGDTVDVSVAVANTGHADTTATLVDTIANLQSPTSIELDGSACGACTTSATAVTAPLGTLAAGGTHVLTYSAAVKSVADGSLVSSSSVVTFTPATTGTSPTSADEQTLTVGSLNTQSWHVAISQQPPASAAVGDTVTVKAKISVDSGADSLAVSGLSSGAGTSGLDSVVFGDTPPFTIAAGDSKEVTATARVTAAPGTGGVALEVSVDAALGAGGTTTQTADSGAITVGEAVSATLSGGPASVTTADQITYTLTFHNASATAAQLSGLPAALTAPAGTTASGPATGDATVPAHGDSAWTLTVDVDDADADGTALTQTPGAVSYAMSDIGLAARTVTVAPPSVTSTVTVPDTTPPDVTINQAGDQSDPTSTAPVDFTVVFSEPVTGFDGSDVSLGTSTAGGTLLALVTGGPTTYTVEVSGMTTAGTVVASVPAGAAEDLSANPSNASTSTDNSVSWVEAIGSSVSVTTTPGSVVYGQPAAATATVGVTSGTPDGTVQFDVDGVDVGSPVAVGVDGTATSPALTGLEPGSRAVTGTFTPSDPVAYRGSFGSTNLVVSQASTTTSLTVGPHTLAAAVSVVSPGAGSPGGSVTFSVDGHAVGTAPVSGGAAALTYTTPAGATRHVAAAYSGDAHFAPSSASTARHDPTITAHVSSAHAKSHGWYRSAVTVSFSCAASGAPLVGACPASVTLHHNGAAQLVSRTIAATDGGMATASVHVNIDHTAPHVSVTGVIDGGHYPRPGPAVHCAASDALSGVASCVLSRHTHGSTVHYRATARDRAGNVATVHGSYHLSGITLTGASYSAGAYTVHRRTTYLLVVDSVTRPAYYDAAPYPQRPFHPDPFAMRSAGHHRWALPVTMTESLRAHRYWNVGVLIGSTLHVLRIRVLP